jgi:hypothetical protein
LVSIPLDHINVEVEFAPTAAQFFFALFFLVGGFVSATAADFLEGSFHFYFVFESLEGGIYTFSPYAGNLAHIFFMFAILSPMIQKTSLDLQIFYLPSPILHSGLTAGYNKV